MEYGCIPDEVYYSYVADTIEPAENVHHRLSTFVKWTSSSIPHVFDATNKKDVELLLKLQTEGYFFTRKLTVEQGNADASLVLQRLDERADALSPA